MVLRGCYGYYIAGLVTGVPAALARYTETQLFAKARDVMVIAGGPGVDHDGDCRGYLPARKASGESWKRYAMSDPRLCGQRLPELNLIPILVIDQAKRPKDSFIRLASIFTPLVLSGRAASRSSTM